MQGHQGFLVVRRVNWFNKIRYPHLIERNPSVPFANEEVVKRYRGVEGTPWPEIFDDVRVNLRHGLASLSKKHPVDAYIKKLNKLYPDDIIDCIVCKTPCSSTIVEASACPDFARFLGFDYGYLVSESNNYSVIFNEVIYGRYPDLRSFGASLNSHFLFPTSELSASLRATRSRLLADGADIEMDEECYPIAIYSVNQNCR